MGEMSVKQKYLIIGLIVLVVLGSASGWVYNFIKTPHQTPQNEISNLQLSFVKQYGTDASITEMINPKIYEVAWTDKDGNKNVSMNVGGVWVVLVSIPKSGS